MIDYHFYMLDKNVFYIIACFWCMWSDHIFYCRPKLIIFQHNGLGVFCRVVTIIFIHYHLLNNVEEKHRPCILVYHNHIIGQPYLKRLYYLSIYHNSSCVKMACFHRQLLSLDGCFLDGLFLDSCSLDGCFQLLGVSRRKLVPHWDHGSV